MYSVKFGFPPIGKDLPALLAICSFYGCFIVFVYFSLWYWRLDVDLIVSIPEFSYLFSISHYKLYDIIL